ncbi:MAG: hypothetical protein IJY66_06560 [Clostridia bacterium]|nr:hypothetical protein [Clostridia bacterium]
MFDIWMGDIELTTFVLIFSIVVILPVQLLLCFKVENRLIRLLPVGVCSVPMICFAVMSATATGWDGIGYLFLSLFAGFMMLSCGVGWGIWAVAHFVKNRKSVK